MDYTGFTFNKRHSERDLGLVRVSTSNRYTTNLAPTMTNFTAQNDGADGQYFFGSVNKQLQFNVDFAFDSLTEARIRELRQLFNGREEGELIFDEYPYKAYRAKVTGTPSLKTICFTEKGEDGENVRIYKGEGNVVFTCYWPYGHTPDWVWTTTDGINFAATPADGRLSGSYSELAYPTKSEWLKVSGLTNDVTYNRGELPAPFEVTISDIEEEEEIPTEITIGNNTIKIDASDIYIIKPRASALVLYDFKWDSQRGLVYLKNTWEYSDRNYISLNYTGNAVAAIPPKTKPNPPDNINLNYHYWYY